MAVVFWRTVSILLCGLLLSACADSPDTTICGVDQLPTTPDAPRIGDFPRVTNITQGFPIAGSRTAASAVRVAGPAGLKVVPSSCDRLWTTTIDLPGEGNHTITLVAESDSGNQSAPTSFGITVDTTPPVAPTVTGAPATTASGSIALTVTREAGAEVRLNGLTIVPLSTGTGTTIDVDVPLPLGNGAVNDLIFTQLDAAGNASPATTLQVTRSSPVGPLPRQNYPLNRQRIARLPGQAAVQLIWNQTGATDTYRVQVATSPAFGPAHMIADQTGTGLTVTLPANLANGTYYWRVATVDPATQVTSFGLTRSFILGGLPGDINGDGYTDVVAGAPGDDGPNPVVGSDNRGGVRVLFGGGQLGLAGPESADLDLQGQEPGAEQGIAVTTGDLNGDGFTDIIAGAHHADTFAKDAGAAYLYLGGATPDATADLTFKGQSLDDGFGLSLASGFDFNGDGIDDLAIAAWQWDDPGAGQADNRGRVFVYLGAATPDNVPDLILTGAEPRENFGSAMAGGVDFNGDGYDDLAIGGPQADSPAGVIDAGRVVIYYGGPRADGIADAILYGLIADEHLGAAVSGAGDMDGDGFDELLAGAPGFDFGGTMAIGRVMVYHGGPTADTTEDLIVQGITECEAFGFDLSGGGDFNGDGLADWISGVPFSNLGASDPTCQSQAGDLGMIEVQYGAVPINNSPDARFIGAAPNDRAGFSVHVLADVNGDGLHDFVAGAPNNDEGSTLFGDTGRAYLLFGPGFNPWPAQGNLTDVGIGTGAVIPGTALSNDGDKDGMGTSVW